MLTFVETQFNIMRVLSRFAPRWRYSDSREIIDQDLKSAQLALFDRAVISIGKRSLPGYAHKISHMNGWHRGMARFREQSETEKAVKAYALALHKDRKARSATVSHDGSVRVFVERLPEDETRCGRVLVGLFDGLARVVSAR
jgi:hypothetical protein